jgi:predicted permease
MMAESGMLAVVGGVLGLALAWGLQRALVAAAPPSVPRLEAIAIDWRVVAFTAAITGLTALFIGLVPAWRAARENAADALRAGGRSATAHGATGRARRALVAAEVTLAVVTLAGSGLLLRSLWTLQRANLGFDPRSVLTAKVAIAQRDYDDARTVAFYDELITRVRALPGIRGAAASRWLPVVDAGGLWGYQVEGRSYEEARWPSAVPQQVTPGYFVTIGMPLVAGRDFGPNDREGSIAVAIVSKKLSDAVWPGENPLGKRLRLGPSSPYMTVVGVVGDFRSRGYDDTPEPTLYFPHTQAGRNAYYTPRDMSVLIRVTGDPTAIAPSLRSIVRSLDRTVPVSQIRTLESIVGTSVANRQFTTMLLAGFAGLALLLAGVGIYGVISYGVAERTNEIGVRMALGAEQGAVLRLVLSEALRMCGVGLVIGLLGAVVVARAARAMLVGVSVVDPATFLSVCGALLAVAAVAALVPARRAAAVNPSEALRG